MHNLVYRGQTCGSSEIRTKLPSITFSTYEVAKHYSMVSNDHNPVIESIVFRAQVKLYKPIFNQPKDAFVDFDYLVECIGFDNTFQLFKKLEREVKSTNAWEDMCYNTGIAWESIDEVKEEKPECLNRLALQCYLVLDDHDFIDTCKALGYDGAIYRGSGVSRDTFELRVFNTDNITEYSICK